MFVSGTLLRWKSEYGRPNCDGNSRIFSSFYAMISGLYISTKNRNFSIMDFQMLKLFRSKVSTFYWILSQNHTISKQTRMIDYPYKMQFTVGQNGSVASLKTADSWLGFSFCTCSKGPRTLFKKIFGVAQQFLWTD